MEFHCFAIGDTMFGNFDKTGDVINISRVALTPEEAKARIECEGAISCCNSSHVATIKAMKERFGIDLTIPGKPPRILLDYGDSVIVMGVRGLPRLTDRHEYTEAEVASATFAFSKYTVVNYTIVP